MAGTKPTGRKRTAHVALSAALALIMSAVFGLAAALPAAAAPPYQPTSYRVIDCQANALVRACIALNAAPDCATDNTNCFTKISTSHPGVKTWWLNPSGSAPNFVPELCEGTDTACLATGSEWIYDHAGPSPDVASDEQVPIAVPTPPTDTTPSVYSPDGSCDKVSNDFSTCNIVNLANGLQYYALTLSILGILLSAIFWVVGSRSQNEGQELTGKRGIVLCCVAAFCIGVIPGLVSIVDGYARTADSDSSGGITTVTNP